MKRKRPNWEARLRAQIRLALGSEPVTKGNALPLSDEQAERNLMRKLEQRLGPVRESAPIGGRIVTVRETVRCLPDLPIE